MKSKKKLLAIFTSLLMLLSFTGCTKEEAGYLKKISEVSNWKYSTETGKVNMGVSVSKEIDPKLGKLELNMNIKDAYVENVKGKQKMVATIDFDGFINVKDATFYMDDTKLYAPKSVFESSVKAAAALSDEKKVEFPETKAEYIVIDSAEDEETKEVMKSFKKDGTSYTEQELKMLSDLGQILEFKTDLKKQGEVYTLNVDSDKMVDKCVELMDKVVSKLDKVVEVFQITDITKENIAELQKSYEEMRPEMIKSVPEVKTMLKGSRLDMKADFSKRNEYTSNASLNIKLKDMGEFKTVSDVVVKKLYQPKEIQFPKEEQTIGFEEYKKVLDEMKPETPEENADTKEENADTKKEEMQKVGKALDAFTKEIQIIGGSDAPTSILVK